MKITLCVFTVALLATFNSFAEEKPVIRVGSKNFTESYILAEILAQKIEASGIANVDRRFGMGGTGILYEALRAGKIDVYPEYSGTLSLTLLNEKTSLPLVDLAKRVEPDGIKLGPPLGFNNSYGLAVRRSLSEKLGLTKISQLKDHANLRMAFSYEFMERSDGFRALTEHYRLNPKAPTRMDHALVYTALSENKSDLIEVYTTDSKIKKFDLVILEDDLNFFPKYEGLFLVRDEAMKQVSGLAPLLAELRGMISDQEMIRLNGLVELSKQNFSEAASQFVNHDQAPVASTSFFLRRLQRQTKQHLVLVLIPTLISIFIGIPLGIAAAKFRHTGQIILIASGLVQTIPSLALLCFLLPLFGIGTVPAVIALILYGLLPIVRGTHGGITNIDRRHHEVAKVLGLNWFQKLSSIEIPLAFPHILSGIKTATIINVGMATLAAFVGAGGYGASIVTGLALNNNSIILQGALPAAGMALIMHFLFEIAGHWMMPKGLRN